MEYWWSMTGIFMQWRNVFRLPMDKDGIWVGSSSHIFYQNHCGNASSVRILWTYNHTTIFSGPNLTFKYFQNCLQLQLTLCETRGNMMFMWIMKSTKSTKGWDAIAQIPGSSWQEANGLTLFTDFTTFLAPFAKRSPPLWVPGSSRRGMPPWRKIIWSMEVKRHNSNASGIDSIFSGWNHIHIELLIGKRQPVLKVCLKLADPKHDVLSLFSLLKFRGLKVILLASHDCTSAYVMRKWFYKEELWKKHLPESLRKLPCWHRQ